MVKSVNTLLTLSFLTLSSVAYGGFDVMDGDDLASNPSKYGNSHTLPFRKAIQGDENIGLNDDKSFSDANAISMTAPKVGQTFFIAAHLGRPSTTVKKVNGRINAPAPTGSTSSTLQNLTEHLFNFSLALGYRWTNWAVDTELLLTEGLDYNLNPMFNLNNVAYGMNSSISNYALLFNVHYFFPRYFNWVPEALAPHINFGIGPNYKRIKAQLMNNNQAFATDTNNNFDYAWNTTFGLAYRLTNNFLIDLSYRYIDYGNIKFGPFETAIPPAATKITADAKATDFKGAGFHLGVLYEMG